MLRRNIIVIGASAGGVTALSELVNGLPPDLPATIFIVLHTSPHGGSVLPKILSRSGPLQATHPEDGEKIVPGHIYVAPPDYHLLLKPGHIHLFRGPKENGHRPAIDPLFRTAAISYGQRVIGVILSGLLDDGTAGLMAIKIRGGIAVVQDPADAAYSGMPRSAIENVEVDQVLPLSEMALLLTRLVHEPVEESAESDSNGLERESEIAELELEALQSDNKHGEPSNYGCPDCGGTLWEIQEGQLLRFRCRIGHAYSARTLLAKQSESLEDALWAALRALEESASLSIRMAKRAHNSGHLLSAKQFEEKASTIQRQAALIRKVLLEGDTNGTSSLELTDDRDSDFSLKEN